MGEIETKRLRKLEAHQMQESFAQRGQGRAEGFEAEVGKQEEECGGLEEQVRNQSLANGLQSQLPRWRLLVVSRQFILVKRR